MLLNKYVFLIFLLFISFSDEERIDPEAHTSSHIAAEILIEPSRAFHYPGEGIRVRLINYMRQPVYIVRPSGISSTWRLQKLDYDGWRNMDTRNERQRRVGGVMAVSYSPIEAGGELVRYFPYENMRELGKEIRGTYRYTVTLTTREPGSSSVTIYSREFRIR